MVVAVAAPILVFVVVLLNQLEEGERSELMRRTVRDAQSLAGTVERQLHDMSVTLRLLADYPELAQGDLRAYQDRTEAALRSGSYYLLLVDKDGRQLLNTRVPYGTQLGRTSAPAALRSALEGRQVKVSDAFYGQTSQRWVFNVTLPLPQESDRPLGDALILTQNVEVLARVLDTSGLPAGWHAALIDSSHHFIASTDGSSPGDPVPQALADGIRGMEGIVESGVGGPGDIAGYARVPGWSWTALVWGPAGSAQSTIASAWRRLLLGGIALVGVAIGAALLVARQLRNSVIGIAEMAQGLGRGEIVAPVETRITELDSVAMVMSEASFDRSQAEDRLRFVLHELAHRTKNLLSVIQAMMRQTARRSDNLEEFQKNVGERLQGLARSIDLMTAENWGGVWMTQLVKSQMSTFLDSESRLELSGADLQLKPEAVQNLGMAIHELATNAVKYGALSASRGRISFEWEQEPDPAGETLLVMRWIEQGGPPVTPSERKGFGSMVIKAQVEAALRGQVELDHAPEGLRWTARVPLDAVIWKPGKPARE